MRARQSSGAELVQEEFADITGAGRTPERLRRTSAAGYIRRHQDADRKVWSLFAMCANKTVRHHEVQPPTSGYAKAVNLKEPRSCS